MEIHREVIIEHLNKVIPDHHITLNRYELHKSRDSIMCYVSTCPKKEYVFINDIKRIMYKDYNITLRKYKFNKILNNDV